MKYNTENYKMSKVLYRNTKDDTEHGIDNTVECQRFYTGIQRTIPNMASTIQWKVVTSHAYSSKLCGGSYRFSFY